VDGRTPKPFPKRCVTQVCGGCGFEVKNPIFLECIKIGSSGSVDMSLVKNTVDDFHKQIIDYAIGERKGFFAQDSETALPLGQCFEKIHSWVEEYYKD